VFGIPFPVILYAAIIIVFSIILNRTVYGRQVLAVGGNPTARHDCRSRLADSFPSSSCLV
jgi:ribose/xylose/arabinose/galactoside ABC-type transport system permease subunit